MQHHPLGNKHKNNFTRSKLFVSFPWDSNNRGPVLMTLKIQLPVSNFFPLTGGCSEGLGAF